MKIISVWNLKGGCGKSTISLNIAGGLHNLGKKILLVDLDPQGSSSWVVSRGNIEFDITDKLPKDKPDVDFVIIDHAPGIHVIPPAPIVIVPIRPSAVDYASAKKAMVELKGKKIVRVVNAVDARRKEESVVAKSLEKQGAHIIRSRGCYPKTLGMGLTIFDKKAPKIYGVREAKKEFNDLIDVLISK